MWLAELHRLKGRLQLAATAVRADAEACFRLALSIAREQRAPGLQLRAAVDLARLLDSDGAAPEARELLAAARAAVSGGAQVPDLCEADGLLVAFEQSVRH